MSVRKFECFKNLLDMKWALSYNRFRVNPQTCSEYLSQELVPLGFGRRCIFNSSLSTDFQKGCRTWSTLIRQTSASNKTVTWITFPACGRTAERPVSAPSGPNLVQPEAISITEAGPLRGVSKC